ncbi:MAG: response regulator [Rhodospirillales bacterium]|nr:response regulator [Rhodospirillales bacterium]
MNSMRYDSIKVLVAEPSADLRRQIKSTLHNFGIKNVIDTGNLGVVVDTINEGSIDLLIGDTKMPEGDLSEVVYNIRHGDVGDNPFLVTIILVSDPSKEILKKVIDSGTDVILVKPFALGDISDRIDALAKYRKRFVVTAKYVGPDRRGKTRVEGEEIQLITVPNPLQDKSLGHSDRLKIKRDVESATKLINEQKIERYAVQINWLIDRITPDFVPLDPAETINLDPDVVKYLKGLSVVAEDFRRRLKKTRFLHLSEMGVTLRNMSNSMLASAGKVTVEDLVIMSKLGMTIQNTFDRWKLLEDADKAKASDEAGYS